MSNADIKLVLFNEALRLLGDRKLATLTDQVESRRVLDGIWDAGARDYCLERGQWKFAARAASLTYSPSVEPEFGYQYCFDKPTDHLRLIRVCSDEYMNQPLLHYRETGGYWFADLEEIFVEYVSNDSLYGNDFSRWPQTFRKYVAAYLAREAAPRINRDEASIRMLEKEMTARLHDALANDAMQDPARLPPVSSWRAARGRGGARYSRG